MDRHLFLDLFPNMSVSTSLKELTPYLPIYGLAEISGIDVLSLQKTASLDEAESLVSNIQALADLSNTHDDFDDDSSFTEDNSSNNARKKLNFTSEPQAKQPSIDASEHDIDAEESHAENQNNLPKDENSSD